MKRSLTIGFLFALVLSVSPLTADNAFAGSSYDATYAHNMVQSLFSTHPRYRTRHNDLANFGTRSPKKYYYLAMGRRGRFVPIDVRRRWHRQDQLNSRD